MNGQVERRLEEMFVVYLKELYRHVAGVAEKENVSIRFVNSLSKA